MERLVVEYERTVDDELAAVQHTMRALFRRMRPSRWEMLLVVAKPAALVALAAFALFFRPRAGNQLELVLTILGYSVLIGFLLWSWFVHKPKASYLPPRHHFEQLYDSPENRKALGPCVAAVTPDGFVFSTPGVDTRYFWDALNSVESDDLAVSVWIGVLPAVIVPRRAFATPDDLDQFVRSAREKITEARTSPPPDRPGLE